MNLVCPNCGASASLPREMTCSDHRPVLTSDAVWADPKEWCVDPECMERSRWKIEPTNDPPLDWRELQVCDFHLSTWMEAVGTQYEPFMVWTLADPA